MKGLILSLFFLILYVFTTALLSHRLKVERHSKLFIPTALLALPLFLLAYLLSPPDLGFLPKGLQAAHSWLDSSLGGFILLLNIHSYIDWFFGFNGGFSTSLMLLLFRAEPQGASTQEIIAHYHRPDGTDKIHGWRLPRLEETGYLNIDPETSVCTLTPKGKRIALLSGLLKKTLNLGKGG